MMLYSKGNGVSFTLEYSVVKEMCDSFTAWYYMVKGTSFLLPRSAER